MSSHLISQLRRGTHTSGAKLNMILNAKDRNILDGIKYIYIVTSFCADDDFYCAREVNV